MKKSLFLLISVLLLVSCHTNKTLVKPKPVVIGTDTSYTLLQSDYLSNFDDEESIIVYNSELIKIEETFCFIGDKKDVICITNTIKALSPGKVTKIYRNFGKGIKTLVISYYEDDCVYNLSYFKTKDAYGSEEFVLSGNMEIIFKGKPFTIKTSTKDICKLLVKK